MGAWGKWAFAAPAPLLLASCLLGPGKFTSDLSLRKDGRFVLDYRGEILTNNSEDGPAAAATGKRVHWDVGPGSTKVPEMLVRL